MPTMQKDLAKFPVGWIPVRRTFVRSGLNLKSKGGRIVLYHDLDKEKKDLKSIKLLNKTSGR